MSVRVRQLVLFAAAAVAVIVAAYGIGKVAASYSNDDAKRLYVSARAYATDELVARMNTIVVGGQIPDHTFHLLNGDTIQLSHLLSTRTLLIFLDPTCPTCLGQAEMVVRVAQTGDERRHFLFVTKADETQVRQLQSQLGINCRILRDANGVFHDALNVHSSPFSVLVDTNRVIERIVLGKLLEEEITQMASSGKL